MKKISFDTMESIVNYYNDDKDAKALVEILYSLSSSSSSLNLDKGKNKLMVERLFIRYDNLFDSNLARFARVLGHMFSNGRYKEFFLAIGKKM
jgi:hypothetical protein